MDGKMRQPRGNKNVVIAFVIMLATFIVFAAIMKHYQLSELANNTNIRIGINIWPGYEYLFLAKEKKLYEKHGLNVELVELGALTDVRRAYEQEHINAMASTLIEPVEAYYQSGRMAKIALVIDFSSGADVILGQKNISDIKGLRGKRIGAEPASLGQFIVSRALQLGGLTLNDIDFVPVVQDEMFDAMRNKEVDAVMTYPPLSMKIKSELETKELFSTKLIPGEIADVISFDVQLLENDPTIVQKMQHVLAETLQYIQTNPEESYSILAARQKISVADFKESLEGLEIVGMDKQSEILRADGPVVNALSTIIDTIHVEYDAAENKVAVSEFLY